MKDPLVPQFVVKTEQQIDITIAPTDAQVTDQGYTYNQAGLTYNQAGVMYGGIYRQNQDLAPVFSNNTAHFIYPTISSIIDVGTQPPTPPTPNHQKVVGVGWFMYVAQV